MKTKLIKLMLTAGILGGSVFMLSFADTGMNKQLSQTANVTGSGITTTIPAYYDAKLYNIQFSQLSAQAATTLIVRNPGINFIYQSDPGLPGDHPFISVIDAIPADGMNPVWREVQITFNAGFTPRQFYSDDQVLAAASGSNPEISLFYTNEVYTCPVMGIK
jgi:hypothetical protein